VDLAAIVKLDYMLENLEHLTVLRYNYSIVMPRKNQISADNQQEKMVGWIVGFVDGEGTFSVSINKNSTTNSGWQIFPEFVITQGAKSLAALQKISEFFDCGKLYINRRHDNHKEHIYRYCVRSLSDLEKKIVPFFQQNSLLTAKKDDFRKFSEIIDLMKQRKHLTVDGSKEIAQIITTMNRRKPSRYLLSSETIRQAIHA
jgi:hypothetical protein